jgi:hypothetical protein
MAAVVLGGDAEIHLEAAAQALGQGFDRPPARGGMLHQRRLDRDGDTALPQDFDGPQAPVERALQARNPIVERRIGRIEAARDGFRPVLDDPRQHGVREPGQVAQDAGEKAVLPGQVEDVREVLADTDLAARQSQAEATQGIELAEQAVDLVERQFVQVGLVREVAVDAALVAAVGRLQGERIADAVIAHHLANGLLDIALRAGEIGDADGRATGRALVPGSLDQVGRLQGLPEGRERGDGLAPGIRAEFAVGEHIVQGAVGGPAGLEEPPPDLGRIPFQGAG